MKLSTVLIGFVSVISVSALNVIEANDKNFDDIVLNSGKHSFVDFYADWCGHCKSLAPTLEELGDTFQNEDSIQIVKINADKHKKVGRRYGIDGYPMLKFFKAEDSANPVEYEGGRDHDSLSNFVQSITKKYLYIPKPEQNVLEIDDLNFDSKILNNGGIPSLLAVTASWCGHCKKLHPEYQKLGQVFKNDNHSIIIGQTVTSDVPADKIMQKYKIQGFPTILYFSGKDEEPEVYSGGRTLDQLIYYVNAKTNIHRDEDGKLSPLAGRIEEIDVLVKDLVKNKGKEASSLATDVLSKVEFDKANMSKYYRKLLNKAINGETGFFEKELTRLSNIVAKEKLTSIQLDSMIRRINILSVFSDSN